MDDDASEIPSTLAEVGPLKCKMGRSGGWILAFACIACSLSLCCAFVVSPPSSLSSTSKSSSSRRRRGLALAATQVDEKEKVNSQEEARAVLVGAARERNQEPDAVMSAMRFLERANKKGKVGGDKFKDLTTNGNWRLVFTTGDKKTQKKVGGSINYVPIKTVQVFKPDYTITNGVYISSFPLIKFAGSFTWDDPKSRLDFTFDQVSVLGINLPYNQGETKVQPGFTFMDVTSDYVIARGAGGGLALFLRTDEI